MFPSSYNPPKHSKKPSGNVQGLLPSDTGASLKALVPTSAWQCKQMEDINHVFGVPTLSIQLQNNCTELDESAAGLPKASASLPKQKGKSSHFRGLNQCQKYPCSLKVSDSPVILCSLDTKAETDLQAAEKQVGSHTQLWPQAIE